MLINFLNSIKKMLYKTILQLIKSAYYIEDSNGLLISLIFHTILWIYLADWKNGPIFKISKILIKKYDHIKPNINENNEAAAKIFGVSPIEWWMSQNVTGLHHLVGGGLMLYGMIFNAPHIWVHGLLNEAGGLGLRDYVQILLHKTNLYPNMKPWNCYTRLSYFFWCSHHLVGLL